MQNPSLQRPSRLSPTQSAEGPMQPIEQNAQGYNTFDMTINAPTSQRFGDVTPTFFFECVPGDRIIHSSSDELKANQLVNPLLSQVSAYEDVFTVPISSLYPINWQKMVTNPTKGNDLPDEALPSLNILAYLARLLMLPNYTPQRLSTSTASFYINGVSNSLVTDVYTAKNLFITPGTSTPLSNYIRLTHFVYALNLLSADSLLSRSGYLPDFHYVLSESDDGNTILEQLPLGSSLRLQTAIKYAYTSFLSGYESIVKAGGRAVFYLPTPSGVSGVINSIHGNYTPYIVPLSDFTVFRNWFYSIFSQGGYFAFADEDGQFIEPAPIFSDLSSFYRIVSSFVTQALDGANDTPLVGRYNPSRLLAYNQVCAAYYSNPSVDYIYSSQLYMQNLESMLLAPVRNLDGVNPNAAVYPQFVYNGVSTRFDLLTTGFTEHVFSTSNGFYARLLAFYANFFSFHNSLRYLDFFASARPNMVAIGNTDFNIDLENGTVSAIDTAQSLVRLRFQQAVNRVTSEIHSYLQGVFGVSPVNDMPEPHFCSRQRLAVTRETNTNTSSDLGAQNTNISGGSTTASVDIFIDEECILIGCRTFIVHGSYRSGINPHLFNQDRFEKFNPLLQALGDQPIPAICKTGLFADNERLFGYTERYGEYKMPVSFATGAANEHLNGWFFYYDSADPNSYMSRILSRDPNIKPSFIRHYPYEFDSFFNNPATVDPAAYYHFIISCNSMLLAHRRMSYRSSILWL